MPCCHPRWCQEMLVTSFVALSAGLLLERPIRPRLPTAVAATVTPLALAVAPLPASAAITHLTTTLSDVALTLASRGDGSQGLFASITRDPTDVYYGFIALVGLGFLVKNVADPGP